MTRRILFIDDDAIIREYLGCYFEAKGYEVETACDGKGGLERVSNWSPDILLLDLRLPDVDGLEVLERIKREDPFVGVIIITGHGDVDAAVTAMRLGADHFVLKPVDLDTLDTIVKKVLESYRRDDEISFLRKRMSEGEGENSRSIHLPKDIADKVKVLSETNATAVLILGETGTGKGVTANLIHRLGERRDKPFVDLNCAGLSGDLLESELFGHERGAFTDAKERKKGLFELADGGSLFLDEVGDMPPATQAKLLKVIETQSFRRVGGVQPIKVDVRIMAATNRDLHEAIEDGSFRRDLFFRLNVVPIELPPLRECPENVALLAKQFTMELGRQMGRPRMSISVEALTILQAHGWPGNVRELRNTIERATLLSREDTIRPRDLPAAMKTPRPQFVDQDSDNTLAGVEARHIRAVLESVNGNRTRAARILGIHRATLISKLKKMESS